MPSAMTSSTYEWGRQGRQAWPPSGKADAMWDCEWGSMGATSSYSQGRSAWGGAAWNSKYESSCRPNCQAPAGYTAVALTPGQFRSMVGQAVIVGCGTSPGGQYQMQRTPLVAPKGGTGFNPVMFGAGMPPQEYNVKNTVSASPVDGEGSEPQQDEADSLEIDPGVFPASSGDRDNDKPQLDKAADVDLGELPSVGSAGHADGSCKRCAFFPKGRCLNGKDCSHCHFEHVLRRRFRRNQRQLREAETHFAGQAGGELQTEVQEPEASWVAEVISNANSEKQECDGGDEGPVSAATDIASVSSSPETGCTPEDIDEEASVPPMDTGLIKSDKQDDVAEIETTPPSSSDPEDPCFSMKSSTSRCSSPVHASRTQRTESTSPASWSPEASDCEDTIVSYTSEGGSSPTSWAAQQRARRAAALDSNAEVSPAEIARMARALLNKLTEERFELLCAQVLALPLTSPEHLAALTHEIFEKATTQQFFRRLYTELCMRLDSHLADKEGPIGGKSFRRSLVNECQASFEFHMQSVDLARLEDVSKDEQFEAEQKVKNRRLGNMRFIGELFVRRLLASKVMPPILHELLSMNTEAALESVTALLSVVGPVFDSDKVSPVYRAPLLDAFTALRRKSVDKAICLRVRCQIRDLMDMRNQGWKGRVSQR